LVGRRDRLAAVDWRLVAEVSHGRAGLRMRVQGKTAEARFGEGPTDVPTPGCRSQSVGRSSPGRERPKPSGPDNEAPEATGVERRSLM
jgi:hypothetical protein